ncbi:MAG: hypothetical protein JXB29_06675 [Sedimentisphaerales bacterium]|nr:hypothetical protein [Sedimentisphaerales bacterium]
MSRKTPTLTFFCIAVYVLSISLAPKSVCADTYQYTLQAGGYKILDADNDYQQIEMEGFGQLLTAGKPKLPSKIFSIAVPPAAQVTSVVVQAEQWIELEGTYNILPAQVPMPGNGNTRKIQKANEIYQENYDLVYSKDEPYPASTGKLINQGGYRKYNVVDVRFTPFEYYPQSGSLFFCPTAVVTITYTPAALPDLGMGAEAGSIPEVEETAQQLLINYDDAQQWYAAPKGPAPGSLGVYEFVIITTEDLEDSVWPIKNWEICKGRGVYVATVEWIDTTYTGADLAAKMRKFLRLNYSGWNTLKVLLVGDIDEVPMRYCYTQDPWDTWGYFPTDYYYGELSLDDSASWDDDGDGKYGEEGQDSVDFLNEVDVGRIPWSDPTIVESICMSMAEYEYSADMTYKNNVLLPEAFWDSSTDNALLANMMINDFFSGAGWTRTRMYEYGPTWYTTFARDVTLTHTNMVNYWSANHYSYVCWSGHGANSGSSVIYNAKTGNSLIYIDDGDNTSLDENHPSVVYANSCSTSRPENLNNLGRQLLRQGSVGYVGSTRTMAYWVGWNELSDGWGNTLAYWFSQKIHSGSNTAGWSHQKALRKMYTDYSWDDEWSSMFEYVLYGNPDLWIKNRPTSLPNLTDTTPTGWDYTIVPRSLNNATLTWCPITATLPGNTNNTYYNWALINNGSNNSPIQFTGIYIDDYHLCDSPSAPPAGFQQKDINFKSSKTVTGGRHTMYYNIDSYENVWETNESDNCWGHQFVWSPYALSNNSPRTRSAPPDEDAWGCAPAPHYYNNEGFSFVLQNAHPNDWWSAVGILPATSSTDYDMRLWNIGDYTGSEGGFGAGYLEWAATAGDDTDFVLLNNNIGYAPAGTYYVGVINDNDDTANYRIEEDTSEKIDIGTNGPFYRSYTNVLDVFENRWSLATGNYGFKLEQVYGNCDLAMAIYDKATVHCQKNENMASSNTTGDGGDEFFTVNIPNSGWYGLVVWKVDSSDYTKDTGYKIKFGPCADPTNPAGPDPFDGDTGVSVNTDLDWSDCTDTDHYEVWLREQGGSWMLLGFPEESYWDPDPFEYNTTYEWTIKAVNICGNYAWGPYWDFTTGQEPSITVTTPNGGETWYVGKSYSIRWTSQGVTGNVSIKVSRDGGVTWSTITSSTADDGLYSWTVTSPTSTTCRIKVTSLTYPAATDTSNRYFTIAQPYITVLCPDGGEIWYTGDTNNITWTSGGADKYLAIGISRDNGSKWETITSSTLNDGLYSWKVTGPPSKQCLVRVIDSTVYDDSDYNFAIFERSITVKSPNGGELWYVGRSENISWSSSSITGNVKIEISDDNGSNWYTITASTTNDGSYYWTVSDEYISGDCLIRVTSIDFPAVSDTSNNVFALTYRSDLNLDWVVDWLDLRIIRQQWQQSGDPLDCPYYADISEDDCLVNFIDFALFVSEYTQYMQ